MTKQEIEKLLKKNGFEKKSGGRHDIWKKDGSPPFLLQDTKAKSRREEPQARF